MHPETSNTCDYGIVSTYFTEPKPEHTHIQQTPTSSFKYRQTHHDTKLTKPSPSQTSQTKSNQLTIHKQIQELIFTPNITPIQFCLKSC